VHPGAHPDDDIKLEQIANLVTKKTEKQRERIAEDTLAAGTEATPGDEVRARIVATSELRAIAEAADELAAAEARLREAVQVARVRGHSWNRIGKALGTSGQAARVRFSRNGTPAPKRAVSEAKNPFGTTAS
jgi:hypothetical protein